MKSLILCENGTTLELTGESKGALLLLLFMGFVEWNRDNKEWRAKYKKQMVEDLLDEFEIEYT